MMFIKNVSPWFVEEGTMTLDEWKRVGKEMRWYVQKNGEKTLPPQTFPLWLQLREILTEETPSEGLIREMASEFDSPTYDEVGPEDGTEEERKPQTICSHSLCNSPFRGAKC